MRRKPVYSRANGGMRAFVTSSDDARAKRHACALRPHAMSCGELKARGTRAARSFSRSTHRLLAAISGGARVKAGDACDVLQAPRLLRWQRSIAADGAMVPVETTEAGEGNSTRTDSRAAPATHEVPPDASILRHARDRCVAQDAFASTTEATNVAWPLLKNRVLTSSMNTWPPLAGCFPTRRLEDGRLRLRLEGGETSLRPSWERPLLLSGVLRRLRSHKTHCAFLTRYALTARTKQYGLTSRSTGPKKTQLS